MQSRQLLLECFACQIFNSDISFTSTSTSSFITSVKSVQKSYQSPRAQSEKTLWRLEIILRSIFIMKRAGIFHDSANNRGSWSRKSDCVTLGKLQDDMLPHTRRKNSLDSQSAFCTHSAVCSLHFVPSLHYLSCLQSKVCILYWRVSVAPIQFIFDYSYSHNTHNLPQNSCVWVNSTFSFFAVLIFFFPFVKM